LNKQEDILARNTAELNCAASCKKWLKAAIKPDCRPAGIGMSWHQAHPGATRCGAIRRFYANAAALRANHECSSKRTAIGQEAMLEAGCRVAIFQITQESAARYISLLMIAYYKNLISSSDRLRPPVSSTWPG
jgi:hypothetical protein